LATFSERWASLRNPSEATAITFQSAVLVFTAVALPVHIWSILHVLEELPAWLLRLSVWELLGVIAYTQAFALFESLGIFLIVLIPALILPKWLFANHFVALAGLLVFTNSLWAILLQQNYATVSDWGARQFLPWLALYALSMLAVYVSVLFSQKLSQWIRSFLDRTAVLAGLYITIDVISVLIVLIRNLPL